MFGELLPRIEALAERAAGAGIPVTLDAEEADRLELSLELFERSRARAVARRLGRARPRGPGVPAARDPRLRLARRARRGRAAPAHGPARQGRVLGHRDQARAGARARRLPGLHPQAGDRRVLHRLRAGAARGRRTDLPAVRDPQRPLGRDRARVRRRTPRLRVPEAARHGRRAVRGAGRRRRASPAASTRRSAAIATCSPISCAGCSRTAPTAPSSTRSATRTRRSSGWWRTRSKRCRAPYAPHPRVPRPRYLLPDRLNSRGVDLADRAVLARLARADRRAIGPARRPRRRASRGRSPSRPTAAGSSARCADATAAELDEARARGGARRGGAGTRRRPRTRAPRARARGRPARETRPTS